MALNITELGEHRRKVQTIERRLVGIAAFRQDVDLDPPTRDRSVWRTITDLRRSLTTWPAPKDPLRTEHLPRELAGLSPSSARLDEESHLLTVRFERTAAAPG